jgi:hypothetical protein
MMTTTIMSSMGAWWNPPSRVRSRIINGKDSPGEAPRQGNFLGLYNVLLMAEGAFLRPSARARIGSGRANPEFYVGETLRCM